MNLYLVLVDWNAGGSRKGRWKRTFVEAPTPLAALEQVAPVDKDYGRHGPPEIAEVFHVRSRPTYFELRSVWTGQSESGVTG